MIGGPNIISSILILVSVIVGVVGPSAIAKVFESKKDKKAQELMEQPDNRAFVDYYTQMIAAFSSLLMLSITSTLVAACAKEHNLWWVISIIIMVVAWTYFLITFVWGGATKFNLKPYLDKNKSDIKQADEINKPIENGVEPPRKLVHWPPWNSRLTRIRIIACVVSVFISLFLNKFIGEDKFVSGNGSNTANRQGCNTEYNVFANKIIINNKK